MNALSVRAMRRLNVILDEDRGDVPGWAVIAIHL